MAEHALVIILLAPLFAAILVGLFGSWKDRLCLPLVVGGLLVSLWACLETLGRVSHDGPFSYFPGGWDSPRGIGIELRADGLNSLVLVIIVVVALLTSFYSKRRVAEETPGKTPQFYTLYLLMVTGVLGMTITADAFNLYVLLEVSSLTGYALVAIGSSRRAALAAFNYVIMGTIGASFYLLGVGYLYIKTGSLNMAGIQEILQSQPELLGSNSIHVAFIFILMGLWIKMAFFPLYGWLPNAYSYSPSTTGCLIAPIMTKVSIYVMIRMMLTVFGPEYVFAQLQWTDFVVWLAVIAIVAASLLALAQTELRKMLSYLIVAEVGYMVGGAWLANHYGLVGAIFHIISDALMTLCLFLAAGIFFFKTGSRSIYSLRGAYRRMPLTMGAFTVGAFSMIGVPPTCGFFSKFYLIRGGVEAGHWEFVVALLVSSLINAVLFFRIIETAYFKPWQNHHGEKETGPGIDEAPLSMTIPLVTVSVALLLVGVFNLDVVRLIQESLAPFAIIGEAG